MKLLNKKIVIQVGVWINQQNFEFVWLDHEEACHHVRFPRTESAKIQGLIQQAVRQSLSITHHKKIKLKFISALLPHQIWMKTLILSNALTQEEAEQQCRYLLEKELPISIDELWFDYTATMLKQGFRLDIFAVRIEVAQQQLTQYFPLKIEVMDTVAHCLLKALQYLKPDLNNPSNLLLYQDEQHSIALRNLPHQWQILYKTHLKNTALYQQFTQLYAEDIEQIICFVEESKIEEKFEHPFVMLSNDIPLIALGAALWQRF